VWVSSLATKLPQTRHPWFLHPLGFRSQCEFVLFLPVAVSTSVLLRFANNSCTDTTPLGSVRLMCSNGNASEAKANEGFDNSIFFASEAKRTCSLEGNLLAKRSEHVRKK
jgi:hypothetical protein